MIVQALAQNLGNLLAAHGESLTQRAPGTLSHLEYTSTVTDTWTGFDRSRFPALLLL